MFFAKSWIQFSSSQFKWINLTSSKKRSERVNTNFDHSAQSNNFDISNGSVRSCEQLFIIVIGVFLFNNTHHCIHS